MCLPGYLQSGKVFAEKSSGIRKILTKKYDCQLDYIDPPVLIPNKEELPFVLSADEEEANKKFSGLVDLNVNRCWWSHKSNPCRYEHFDEALAYVVNYIKENGPYDGIIGFSQGAAMAAIVANSIGELLPSHGNFKVAVIISGFAFVEPKNPEDDREKLNSEITEVLEYIKKVTPVPGYEKYFQPPKDSFTSVVLIYGANDAAVPTIRSRHLESLYDPKILKSFVHDGGHLVPNKKQFLAPVIDQIEAALETKSNL